MYLRCIEKAVQEIEERLIKKEVESYLGHMYESVLQEEEK